MKRTLLLAIIALLCTCFLFAGGTQESKTSSASSSSNENQVLDVDTIKVGVPSVPNSMDPTILVGNATIRVHYNIFDTLIYADQDDAYSLKPMLAKSWKRVDDYTLELNLRDDVTFHDGSKFTAADVKFTFDRLLKKKIKGTDLAASLMNTIDHVDIIDDYTVRVVTSVVDPLLETRLASSWGAWILPKDYIEKVGDEKFALSPIGTGPFKVISYSPEKVVLERYDGFWGEAPHVKHLEYVASPESSSRITALITGELDIITNVPADQTVLLENTKGVKAVSLPISNIHLVEFWAKSDDPSLDPINDIKLRQALSYAVDREKLNQAFWGGKVEIPRGHQYPDFGDLYFSDFPVEEYNLEKAKQLLAESSYNGQELTYELRNGYYTFGNEVAEAIIDMWKQIGVNAKVIYKDKEDDNTQIRNWSNSMRFPDPAGGLWLLWGSRWRLANDEWKECGEILTSSLDKDARAKAARRLMEIFKEEVPGILLYYPLENWGVRDGLNWHPYASQTLNFRADAFWATK